MPELISIKRTAEALSVSTKTVDKLRKEVRLIEVTLGRRRMIRSDSLHALINPQAAN